MAQRNTCLLRSFGSVVVRMVGPQARPVVDEALAAISDVEVPFPDPRTERDRIAANVAALKEAQRGKVVLNTLLGFSGWGGLSSASLPAGIATDEVQIHDYHTPHWLAWELARQARELLPRGRTIRALEPAAGGGRLIVPWMLDQGIEWTLVEPQTGAFGVVSEVARVAVGGAKRYNSTLEAALPELLGQRFELIISNPPYGQRSAPSLDPDLAWVSDAQWYFTLRLSRLLASEGVLALLVPAGVLSGSEFYERRALLLQEVELVAAWGLPADVFPAANLNIDALLFRRRQAPWSTFDDQVRDGRYFSLFPHQLLAVPSGPGSRKGRWGAIRKPRSTWAGCLPGPSSEIGHSLADESRAQGERLLQRRDRGSLEWYLDCQDWLKFPLDDPRFDPLRAATRVLNLEALAIDLAADQEVTLQILASAADVDEATAREALEAAHWRPLGPVWYPPLADVWGDVSNVVARARELGDEDTVEWVGNMTLAVAEESLRGILPTERWIPDEVVLGWIRSELGEVAAMRAEDTWVIGGGGSQHAAWLNDDPTLLGNMEEKDREALLASFRESWDRHITRQPWQPLMLAAYSREYRQWLPLRDNDDSAEEEIPRWDFQARRPHGYQWRAARRVVRQRRQMLMLGVGLGKTTTALLAVAWLRARGVVRRPVIQVPASTLPNWVSEARQWLPDYRVGVVGRELDEEGGSKLDTAEDRARVWQALRDGRLDLVISTETAIERTQLSIDAIIDELVDDLSARRVVADAEIAKGRSQFRQTMTERKLAVERINIQRYLTDKLRSAMQDPDPFVWDQVGDMLVVDEAHHAKSLLPLRSGVDGAELFYAGASAEASQRSWHILTRIRSARYRLTLTATPATNGLAELYNTMHLLGGDLWPQRNQTSWASAYIEQGQSIREGSDGVPKSVATAKGIARPADFFSVLKRYSLVLTAKDVGLKLPDVTNETIFVAAEEIYPRLVKVYEVMAEATRWQDAATAIVARSHMLMISVHPELVREESPIFRDMTKEERALYKTRERPPAPRTAPPSPKYRALAENLTTGCGHIVFLPYLDAQRWLKQYLDGLGYENRILSGETEVGEREKIARAFNAGEIDLVILGAVGGEGLNLQKRTCALHHLALPPTPAALVQMNGRGVRQGAGEDDIVIKYYVTKPGPDNLSLQIIEGKADWLTALAGNDITSNPSEESDLDPVEILAEMSMVSDRYDDLIKEMREQRARVLGEQREELRWKKMQSARSYLLAGSPPPFEVPYAYPDVEAHGPIADPAAVTLTDGSRRWYASQGVQVVDARGANLVVGPRDEDGLWFRKRFGWDLTHLSAWQVPRTTFTPAPYAPEQIVALAAALPHDFTEWARIDADTVTAVWAHKPGPRYSLRAKVPRQLGAELVLHDGEVVPPTIAGFEHAKVLARAVEEDDVRVTLWWRWRLPPAATQEQQRLYAGRMDGTIPAAEMEKTYPRTWRKAWASRRLKAPYGALAASEYRDGDRLDGPEWGTSSFPTDDMASSANVDDTIFRAVVAVNAKWLASGVYAAGVLLADGFWRPAILADKATNDPALWWGGDKFGDGDAAQELALLVWGRYKGTLGAIEHFASITVDPKRVMRMLILGTPEMTLASLGDGRGLIAVEYGVVGARFIAGSWALAEGGRTAHGLTQASLGALLSGASKSSTVKLTQFAPGQAGRETVVPTTYPVALDNAPAMPLTLSEEDAAFVGPTGGGTLYINWHHFTAVEKGKSRGLIRVLPHSQPVQGTLAVPAGAWMYITTRVAGPLNLLASRVSLRHEGDIYWQGGEAEYTWTGVETPAWDYYKFAAEDLAQKEPNKQRIMLFTGEDFIVKSRGRVLVRVVHRAPAATFYTTHQELHRVAGLLRGQRIQVGLHPEGVAFGHEDGRFVILRAPTKQGKAGEEEED